MLYVQEGEGLRLCCTLKTGPLSERIPVVLIKTIGPVVIQTGRWSDGDESAQIARHRCKVMAYVTVIIYVI
jgi:hypothetical protein